MAAARARSHRGILKWTAWLLPLLALHDVLFSSLGAVPFLGPAWPPSKLLYRPSALALSRPLLSALTAAIPWHASGYFLYRLYCSCFDSSPPDSARCPPPSPPSSSAASSSPWCSSWFPPSSSSSSLASACSMPRVLGADARWVRIVRRLPVRKQSGMHTDILRGLNDTSAPNHSP
eukprot:GHVT01067547.1.p1 GENE.GHVT01067547.1~~GHVT01067547.1.p1  ORF type:complete len:176 (-),score=51.75 GHVT01067547.1:30-557(-)